MKFIKYKINLFYATIILATFPLIYIFLPILFHKHTYGDKNCITIDNFEESANTLTNKWASRNATKEETSKIYKIKTENKNKFLQANSYGTSIQIARKVDWDLKSYPVLSWRWRVSKIPKGAKEDARGRNDSAAAIYVIFYRNRIPFISWKYQPINVIKYLWSSTLPKEKIVKKSKNKFGKTIYEGRFLVLETGEEQLNKWILEKRNVLLDYIQLFDEKPKYNPFLIGILTDSNDTNSTAICDYDDILLQKLDIIACKKNE